MDNFLLTLDVLKYGILVVILLGLTATLLSPFIVLNEQSMIADGLSHVSFSSLAIGFLWMDEPIYLAVPLVIISSIVIKWMSHYTKAHADSALSMVSSFMFAVGLIAIKFSNQSIDLESLISGNIWFRTSLDLYMTLGLFIAVGLFILINYRKLINLTFDYQYAKFSGVKVNVLSYTLAAFTGLFVLIGVRSIGVLLISSLLIFPLVTANIFSKRFRDLFIYGTIFSMTVIILGIFLAHILNIPAGSFIVILYTLLYSVLFVLNKTILRRKVT